MRPTGQRSHSITPGSDVLALLGDVEAELFRRIVEVASEGNIGDGRLTSQHKRSFRQPLIDDREIAVYAALEKGHYCRITGWSGEVLQKPVRSEESVYFLIIENNPAQRLKPGIFTVRLETAGAFGEIGEDHPGLAQFFAAVCQDWRLAHLIDLGAIFRCAGLALKKINEDRLPIGTDQIEHQRDAIAIA